MINMTFEELCNQLKLNTLNDEMRLSTLKNWCAAYISRDIHYHDEACYPQYLHLAQHYLDFFIPLMKSNFIEEKAELEHLTPIQYAAYQGYHRLIESLDSTQATQCNASTNNTSPLHLAAQCGHEHTVQALIAQGASLTKTNQRAELSIHVTLFLTLSATAQLKAIKESIFRTLWQQAPETLMCQDYTGDTVFHHLASGGYDQLLSDVLDSNPDGAFCFNNHSHYPIHTAILNNQLQTAERLLLIPTVATLTDAKHRAAIHYAPRYGQQDMMELCLSATDDINLRDTEGKTALTLAHEMNNLEAIEVLMNHGAKNNHLRK